MTDWPREEEDLRAPVRGWLEGKGYTVQDEVWINGRIADLYAYQEGDEPVAVELKLTDWKTAVRQAEAYQLGALFTYIALPILHVPKILRQARTLRSRNVGLLGIAPGVGGGFRPASEDGAGGVVGSPDVRELIEPAPSERFLSFLASKIVQDVDRPKRRPTRMPRGWW